MAFTVEMIHGHRSQREVSGNGLGVNELSLLEAKNIMMALVTHSFTQGASTFNNLVLSPIKTNSYICPSSMKRI